MFQLIRIQDNNIQSLGSCNEKQLKLRWKKYLSKMNNVSNLFWKVPISQTIEKERKKNK